MPLARSHLRNRPALSGDGSTWSNRESGLITLDEWNNETDPDPLNVRGFFEDGNPTAWGQKTVVSSGYGSAPPIGGPRVVQSTFFDNVQGGHGPGRLEYNVGANAPGTVEIYLGFIWKFASTFQHSPVSNKLAFILGTGWRTFLSYGNQSPNVNNIAVTFGSSGWGADTNGSEHTSVAITTNDVWRKVEWYLKLMTGGGGNGIMRLWVDGSLAAERTNLTTPTAAITEVYDEGEHNGDTNDTPRLITPGATRWTAAFNVSRRAA